MLFDPIYYVRETAQLTCGECAVTDLEHDLKAEHHRGEVDPALRLLAAIRLARLSFPHRSIDVEDVERMLPNYWETYNGDRDRAAILLLHDVVSNVTDEEHSHHGEYCGSCLTELVPAWITCRNCGHSNYAADFDSGGYDIDHEGDAPTSEYCSSCADDDPGDGEELTTDDRGYTLRYGTRHGYRHGAVPCYSAGCRRFTLEQALAHWGDPAHPEPEAARQLFDAVLNHAMRQALPRLVTAADRW